MPKNKVEIFSAGCGLCDEAVALINKLVCGSCEVVVRNMRQPEVVARAKRYGVGSVPAVAVNGALATCCAARGMEESSLRAAGIGAA